jgi:putative phosphoribosyl transferase
MDSRRRFSYFSRVMYANRQSAGRQLAALLGAYANRDDTIVLALPRGGVPVAKEVAQALKAPLDVLVVRKLGLPWQPELAAGAIAPGGVVVMNPEVQAASANLEKTLAPVIERERAEMHRRESLYRKKRPPLVARGRIAIVIDDGIATGATMQAAVLALRAMQARSVVIAVPVAPPDTIARLARLADHVVCPQQPADFMAVGQWYGEFAQVSDAEVIEFLKSPARTPS